MGTVYIEVFCADNFLVNFLILFLCTKLLAYQNSFKRLFAASAAGCAYAVAVMVCGVPYLEHIAVKVSISVGMCLLAFSYRGVRALMQQILSFYVVTFLLGGAAYASICLFGGSVRMGGILISSPAFSYMLLGLLVTSVTVDRFVKTMRRVQVTRGLIYELQIIHHGTTVNLPAFLDTGNRLFDEWNTPVILIEQNCMHACGELEIVKLLPYRTLSGTGELPVVRVDAVLIGAPLCKKVTNPLIALFNGKLSDHNEFHALIGPDICGG